MQVLDAIRGRQHPVRPRQQAPQSLDTRAEAVTRPALMPRPADVKALTDKSVGQMFAQGDADGFYRTLYNMGPFPAAATSAALNFVGVEGAQFFKDDKAGFATIMGQQHPDGSFSPYPGAPPSKDITSLVLLAIDMAGRNPDIQQDPAFLKSLQKTRHLAESYVKSDAPSADPGMLRGVYQVLHDTCRPDAPRLSPPIVPTAHPNLLNWLEHGRLGSKLAAQLSLPASLLLPSVGILSYTIDKDRPAHCAEDRILKLLHLDGKPGQALQSLQEDISRQQCRDGGWYIALATALNMAALKQRGVALQDPAMQRSVGFIESLQRTNAQGESERNFVAAEVWDTACAGQLFLYKGVPASHPKLAKMIDSLLDHQDQDGMWAFGADSEHFGDKDSTGAVCQFLTQAYATAGPAQKPRIKAALQQATETLLTGQLHDGGMNGWGNTLWRFGRRTPSTFEAAMFDASSTDVSGRILDLLVSERRAGVLDPALQTRADHAADRMQAYLIKSQSSNGSWWSRWMAGYMCSPAFVAPGLRLQGVSPHDPCMVKLRDFLTRSQQDDGGWGEVNEADIDKKLAGQGPSTPVQTAMGLMASIASSPTEDIR
ncbi:MAG TPA: prenyltransferase/squalene oxidase repeat-containing protein, partial [Candidatus Xenobia bacterium]